MHPNAERVQQLLAKAGITTEVLELSDSTRTAAEAAAAMGVDIAQIAKSLVFMAGDQPVLVIASGANRVDVDKLARLTDTEIRRATADQVREATGFPIGGVAPLGHAHPLPTYVDADILLHDRVWAAAGTPHTLFAIAPSDLLRVTGGQAVTIREGQDIPFGTAR